MATGPALAFGQLTFPLNKVTNTLGRKDRITNQVPDVDLGVLDQERSVSRRQAELTYERGVVSVRDVGSTNGTTVNDERLAHQVDQVLNDGDLVGFGGVTMSFVQQAEWPEGVEPEWPPEVAATSPDETMIATGMAEETMLAAPGAGFDASETAVLAPPVEPTLMEPTLMEPPAVEPEPSAPAPQPVEAYAACSNHSHLPAVGLCPGCLEAFCVDCLPEREDGLMVCNRCAGISYRLAAAVQAEPGPAAVPVSSTLPSPAPVPGPGAASEAGDKRKRWPF